MEWTLGDKLGYGAFALVYACAPANRPDDFSFAHKRLQNDAARVEVVVKRFEREVEILRALDHPNVMTVIDSGTSSKGVPWLVMPKADISLEKMLKNPFTLGDADWASRIMLGVLAGVAHAHDRGYLHRDLKPANILLFGALPKVSDFGIARDINVDETRLTGTAEPWGTARYTAPEQAADAKRATAASDVFSLGKIFMYMVTGTKPDSGLVDVTVVPERYRFFVSKCCRENPASRYPDAGAALKALHDVMEPEAVELPALDQAQALMAAAATSRDLADLDALDDHLARHASDQQLQRQVIPTMPPIVLSLYLRERPDRLRGTVQAYDAQLDDEIHYEYADVVADFYHPIFKQSDDIELLELTLTRLITMGRRRHRYHVNDVVTFLLVGISDDVRTSVAVDVIDNNQYEAAWYAENALKKQLRSSIAAALRRAQDKYGDTY